MDKNDILPVLEKIMNGPTFANKEAMKGLLKYLYESSEKGHVLKEMDIAIDYFKRGNDFVPGDDTIVRVNIHKLRSLLDIYYQHEGKKDNLVIDIPKGAYTLKFAHKGKRGNKRNPWALTIVGSLLLVSVLANLFFLLRNTIPKPGTDNPVWTDYMQSGRPVDIILGDPFFYRVNDSLPETIIVRNIRINSAEELAEVNKGVFPGKDLKIKPLNYPYFTTNNVRPLPDIIAVFSRANTDIRLQALSEVSTEDIKRNNCIFLANINSFRYITKFLEQTSIRLQTNPRQIIVVQGADRLVFSVPEFIHGYYTDYAFMAKIPGPENNLLTIMGDFHGSGINGLTNFITRKASLAAFEKKIKHDYGAFPKYFEMVVKVVSYNYSDFNTEVIYFKPIGGNK
jgi:hypothetical protein